MHKSFPLKLSLPLLLFVVGVIGHHLNWQEKLGASAAPTTALTLRAEPASSLVAPRIDPFAKGN